MMSWPACLVATAAFSVVLFGTTPAHADVFPDTVFDNGFEPCRGLECQFVACAGGGSTTISGTVFMPNGSLTVPAVQVYIPNAVPASLPAPPVHARCNEAPSGHPVAATLSTDDGTFVLRNVPAGTNIPVVLVAGKWRRQVLLPTVTACTDTAMPSTLSRFPRTRIEGDIPHIAIATGSADSTECLVRKLGIEDSELGIAGGAQRVHLYSANGADHFDSAHGGASFPSATELWASQSSLSAYDHVLIGCEGAPNPSSKPQNVLDGFKGYVDAGGRAQLAHWGNYWIQANAASWVGLATWDNALPSPASVVATIDTSPFAGQRLAHWMITNGFATDPATFSIQSPKHTLVSLANAVATRRLAYAENVDGVGSVQLFEAATPVEAAMHPQGRLIFTDMHPSGGDASPVGGTGYPSAGCQTPTDQIAPQDAVLLYSMFEMERCVDDSRE